VRRIADLRFELGLILLGALLYLPFLFAPLGPQEINAGYFFGPFANSWQHFGFFALRGVPLGPIEFLPAEPSQGIPYLNHPPGTAWLTGAFADAEWRLRLPTVLATIASGILLFRLLKGRMPAWAAATAGLLLQTVPAMAFYSQVSYEAPVVCCGLAMWLAFVRVQDGSRPARACLAAAALLGPWFDWSFGFFVLALPLLAQQGSVRTALRRLVLPWGTALVSLALVFLWLSWAKSAPFTKVAPSFVHPHDYVMNAVVLHWPPLGEFLHGIRVVLEDCYTTPLLMAAAVGWLLCGQPRLMLALALPGILNVLMFPSHASSHTMFLALLAPAVTAGAGALLAYCNRATGARWPVAVAAALLLFFPAASSVDLLVWNRSALLREVGTALTTAAEGGDGPAPDLVGTNAYHIYPYYVRSDRVELWPVNDPAQVEDLRRLPQPPHLRFLLIEAQVHDDTGKVMPGPINLEPVRPLAEYLHQFPGQRIGRLEGTWPLSRGHRLEIVRATVYDL
jgi:hypothetical protein